MIFGGDNYIVKRLTALPVGLAYILDTLAFFQDPLPPPSFLSPGFVQV